MKIVIKKTPNQNTRAKKIGSQNENLTDIFTNRVTDAKDRIASVNGTEMNNNFIQQERLEKSLKTKDQMM